MGEREADEDRGAPRAWERLESEQLADYEMFRVRRDRARSPRDGSEHTFHVAESPDGVAVVALTEGGGMVLVEQFRHPLRETSLELPSGVAEAGEAPEAAAARELREETGYEGEPARVIGMVHANPSWQVTRVFVAVVRGARKTREKEQDAAEDVHVRVVPAENVRAMAASGRIRSAVAVAALALWAWGGNGAREGA